MRVASTWSGTCTCPRVKSMLMLLPLLSMGRRRGSDVTVNIKLGFGPTGSRRRGRDHWWRRGAERQVVVVTFAIVESCCRRHHIGETYSSALYPFRGLVLLYLLLLCVPQSILLHLTIINNKTSHIQLFVFLNVAIVVGASTHTAFTPTIVAGETVNTRGRLSLVVHPTSQSRRRSTRRRRRGRR